MTRKTISQVLGELGMELPRAMMPENRTGVADGILLSTFEAAATLLVGVDIFRNELENSTPYGRVITGLTCVGSTAIRDFEFDLYAGKIYLGHYYVTRVGAAIAPILPDDLRPVPPTLVLPGTKIAGRITNAAVGNPVLVDVYGQVL